MAGCTCETTSVSLNISSEGTEGSREIWCPRYNECCDEILANLSFWLEGVVQTTFAITGILSNLGSSVVLASKEMRNAFNLMLIALAFFDSCYLFGSILESFRKSFQLATHVHTHLFPYFLYPGQMIMMTASIFMTVAIAMERYAAVHYPLDYNQAMNDERASFRRLLKYVIPVLTFSLTFNIPKFMEAEIAYDAHGPILKASELRTNPEYFTYYNNWTRLAILGIIPATLLIFFNAKIYQDIQERRARRCPRNPPQAAMIALNQNSAIADDEAKNRHTPSEGNNRGAVEDDGGDDGDAVEEGAAKMEKAEASPSVAATHNADSIKVAADEPGRSTTMLGRLLPSRVRASKTLQVPNVGLAGGLRKGRNSREGEEPNQVMEPLQGPEVQDRPENVGVAGNPAGLVPLTQNSSVGGRLAANAGDQRGPGAVGSRSNHNVNRRRMEDNLAMIFMGIVLVFLVCHFPRIVLALHETMVIKDAMSCSKNGENLFPFWALIFSHFSHLLLVLNCSVNSIIYCLLSSKFRAQAYVFFCSRFEWVKRLGAACCSSVGSRADADRLNNGSPRLNGHRACELVLYKRAEVQVRIVPRGPPVSGSRSN